MKKSQKLLASLFVAAMSALPAFANTTQLTLTATVDNFLTVQLVRSSDQTIVSTDNNALGGASYESLSFGNVDARGLSTGTLTSSKGLANGTTTLSRVLLDPSSKVFTTTAPPATVEGALYYVEGYSVVTNRSGGGTTAVTVKQLAGDDINAVIGTAGSLTMAAGSTFPAASIRTQAEATSLTLDAALANNTLLPIKAGLYVKNSTTSGAKSATIEFTGS